MQLCAWLGASKSNPRPCGERSVLDPAVPAPSRLQQWAFGLFFGLAAKVPRQHSCQYISCS